MHAASLACFLQGALSLNEQLAEMVWDFVSLGELHLLFINRFANGLQIQSTATACDFDKSLKAVR